MKIQVTEQHIHYGLKGSCTSDCIALAMGDAGCCFTLGLSDFVRQWLNTRGDSFSINTQDEVLRIYEDFDDRKRLRRLFKLESLFENV